MRLRPVHTEGTRSGIPDPVKQLVYTRMETLPWNRDEPGHKINRNCLYANHVIYKLDSTNWTLKKSFEGQLQFKHKTHRVPCNVSCGHSSHTNAIHGRRHWDFGLLGGHCKGWPLNSNCKIFSRAQQPTVTASFKTFVFTKTHLVTSTMEMYTLQVLLWHTVAEFNCRAPFKSTARNPVV